jgi:2'-5' RNA ligase
MSIAANPLLAHRFFFALRPDEVTARRTRAFAEQLFGEKGLLRSEHLHITLAITEDFDQPFGAVIERLLQAGASVAAPPFEVVLDRLSASSRSIALRPEHVMPPLRTLQKRITEAMDRERVEMRAGWAFSPHQTLVYRSGTPFSRPVELFRWPAREFLLIHSFVGQTKHEILGRWQLEDRQYRLL